MLYDMDDISNGASSPLYPFFGNTSPSNFLRRSQATSHIPMFNLLPIERIIISDLSFPQNPMLMKSYKVTHILQVAHGPILEPPTPNKNRQKILVSDRTNDGPFNLARQLPRAISIMHQALSSSPDAILLIHCTGKFNSQCSCSTSIAAAYEMSGNTIPIQRGPDEALQYIRHSAPSLPYPSDIFLEELYRFARETLGQKVSNPPRKPAKGLPSPTRTSHFVNAFRPVNQKQ